MAMTACTNEEDVVVNSNAQREIGFGAVNYSLSRNVAADGDGFSTTNNMHVSAIYNTEKGVATKYFEDQLFQYKEVVNTKNAWCSHNGTTWSPIYYPANGTMDFMAYSSTADADASWDVLGKSVVLDYSNLDGLDDAMYSDILNAPCSKNTDVQTLQFRHALAWVNVKVVAGNDATAGNLRVQKVLVNNAALGGEATVTFGDPSTVAWPEKTNLTKIDNHVMNPGEITPPYEVTTTPKTWGNGILLPKQPMTTITIVYNVKNLGNWSDDISYTYTCSAGTWTDALKYTYVFNITLNEIKVSGSVKKYTDVTPETEVEI